MSRPLEIKVSPRAQSQIDEAATWWSEHRPAALGAVRYELDRTLGLLCVHPEIGVRVRAAVLAGVRRVELRRIRYYLFYRVNDGFLEVLALWHAKRDRGPRLQLP